MGHYASEMDPDWNKPRPKASDSNNTGDELTNALMDALYGGGYGAFEFTHEAKTAAIAIKTYIDARLKEIK